MAVEARTEVSPGQFFQEAQRSRRQTLRGVRIHGVTTTGALAVSPQYSRTIARVVQPGDLLGSGPVRMTLSIQCGRNAAE